MPNIMVYGFDSSACKDQREKIAQIIVTGGLVERKTYDETVITFIPSDSRYVAEMIMRHDDDTAKQPFLRICGTDEEEIKYLAKLLQKNGYEIETLVLSGFYPKLHTF